MTGAHEAARSRVTQALAATSGEAAHLIRLAKASSQLGDDKQTLELIEKALAAGKSPTAIADAPHFDGLRARSVRLRELLVAAQSKNQKTLEFTQRLRLPPLSHVNVAQENIQRWPRFHQNLPSTDAVCLC
jgi:hypothetical protein